ncbi:MAG: hypothetical protein AAB403_14505, partial [Planctomycetota bacterium]
MSAASFAVGTPLAAETIAAGYGHNLSTVLTVAPTGVPLPTTLSGVSVKVRDSRGTERLAPLWFVSPSQINYLIPAGTRVGLATVTVMKGSQIVATGTLQIDTVSPGLFSANADGRGVAAALVLWARHDGSQVWDYIFQPGCAPVSCVATPIKIGPETDQVFLILFGSGIRGRSALAA